MIHQRNPENRIAQQELANQTTELVHGGLYRERLKHQVGIFTSIIVDGLHKAQTATKVLFGGDLGSVTGEEIVQAFKDDSSRLVQLDRSQVIGSGLDGIATLAKATKSKCKSSLHYLIMEFLLTCSLWY